MTAPTPVSVFLERISAIAPLIRDHVEWSQRERRLAPAVVEAFHDAGLFRLLIPREFGGEGIQEHEVLPMVEAVSRIDASAGWNLAIGNGSSGFIRCLEESAAAEIFAVPRLLAAGSASPTVRFREVEGGYIISGRGQFASGCSQANWIMGAGPCVRETGLALTPAGAPAVLVAFLPVAEAELLDTWNVTGLRGTGSHDVLFHDAFVPAARVGELTAPQQRRFDPLGAIPIMSRLGSHLTGVAIGSAWHAIDELKALAGGKVNFGTASLIRDRADVQIAIGRAAGLVDAARPTCTFAFNEVMQRTLAGTKPTMEDLVRMRLSYVTATALCVQAVDLVHAAAGTSTLAENSVIGRCWRDVHAVSQHVSQQGKHYENGGRVMLGLAPAGMA